MNLGAASWGGIRDRSCAWTEGGKKLTVSRRDGDSMTARGATVRGMVTPIREKKKNTFEKTHIGVSETSQFAVGGCGRWAGGGVRRGPGSIKGGSSSNAVFA